MTKLWVGRTDGQVNKLADEFNASIGFDSKMYSQDVKGSIAHAKMLGAQGIISAEETEKIVAGLAGILADLQSGKLEIDMGSEDIHSFVEQELTSRIGDAGKKLHTARSRNDQVALDLRLYLKEETQDLLSLLTELIGAFTDKAEEHAETIMPGYTHLQRAQPICFGHQLLAYANMLLRDKDRLKDCLKRMNVSPIGACALAGTTYDTDRRYEAAELGFDGICANSIDAVSDRDFCVELMSDLAICMMHLSRASEELILWSSWEFGFIRLADEYTTGSSIMPQKKNSDMAELVRGKTGRVYGNLMALLTTLKGLPLAYNKDMQEDKEAVFDSMETAKLCVQIFTGMIATMQVFPEKMLAAAQTGFINATDMADYLVSKGLPFRDAYKLSGEIVAHCQKNGEVLETLTLESYKSFSKLFDSDIYEAINLKNCVARRNSEGGTSPDSVRAQIKEIKKLNK